MNKKLLLVIFCGLFFNHTFGQYKLIEKIEENTDPYTQIITYSKYQLDNGLTVILHERRTDPIIHVDLTFRIGSVAEDPDKAGNVYFISQLMKNISDKVPGGDYSQYIKKYGGKCYTEVGRDKTTYSVTASSKLLKSILWFESERIAKFTTSITEDEFIKQKEIMLQWLQDNLYGTSEGYKDILTYRNIFEYGHPYSWTSYGKIKHYQRVSLPELKKFYLDWYGVNNAILTISGDFDNKKTLKLIKKYFGSLTPSPKSFKDIDNKMNRINSIDRSIQDSNRYISFEYEGKKPTLRIIYPTVTKFHADKAFLDIFADFLGKNNWSFLNARLANNQLIESINVTHSTSKYAGELIIDAIAAENVSLSKVQNAIIGLIDSFFNPEKVERNMPIFDPKKDGNEFREPFSIFDFSLYSKYIGNYRIELLESLESNKRIATKLADYEFYLNSPNYIDKELKSYNFFNPEKILEVSKRYIIGQYAVIISMVPKGRTDLIAAPDNFTAFTLQTIIIPVTEDSLKYRPIAKNYWKKIPKIKKAPKIEVPSYSKNSLKENNLVFLIAPIPESSMITLKFRKKIVKQVGTISANQNSAEIIATMLRAKFNSSGMRGVGRMFSEIGIMVDFTSIDNDLVITIKTQPENLINNPMLINELFSSNSDGGLGFDYRQLISLINEKFSPQNINYTQIAKNIDSRTSQDPNFPKDLINNEDHMLTMFLDETFATFQMVYNPSNAIITYVGKLFEGDDMNIYYEPFRDNRSGAYGSSGDFTPQETMPFDSTTIEKSNVFFLSRENPVNTSTLIISYPEISMDLSNGNYLKSDLMSFVLNNGQNSDLNKLSEKDYILNISSSLHKKDKNGILIIETEVQSDKVDSAIRDISKTINDFKLSSISKKDLKQLKLRYLFKDIINYETNDQKADLVYDMNNYQIDKNYYTNLPKNVKKVEGTEIIEYANTQLADTKRTILVVGNKDKISDKLNHLELGKIIEINKYGIRIN